MGSRVKEEVEFSKSNLQFLFHSDYFFRAYIISLSFEILGDSNKSYHLLCLDVWMIRFVVAGLCLVRDVLIVTRMPREHILSWPK